MSEHDRPHAMIGGAHDASTIDTYSGKPISLRSPTPDQIRPADIAHGLGQQGRYAGQTRKFYSIAEHSVLVADLLRAQGAPQRTQQAGLLHDAHEAYLGDVTRPLKQMLRLTMEGNRVESVYDDLAAEFDDAIAKRFGLDPIWLKNEEVAVADVWALRIETKRLLKSGGDTWNWRESDLALSREPPRGVYFPGGLGPENAVYRFVNRMIELKLVTAAERRDLL